MTSWHEEAQSPGAMGEVARLCFGGQNQVLVLVVGREAGLRASVEAVRQSLAARDV
jgi:hypothetical protein